MQLQIARCHFAGAEAGRGAKQTCQDQCTWFPDSFGATTGLCNIVSPMYHSSQSGISSLKRTLCEHLALVLLIAVLATSARAQSLQIKGKFGYLGEYEFFATVSPQTSGAKHRTRRPFDC